MDLLSVVVKHRLLLKVFNSMLPHAEASSKAMETRSICQHDRRLGKGSQG